MVLKKILKRRKRKQLIRKINYMYHRNLKLNRILRFFSKRYMWEEKDRDEEINQEGREMGLNKFKRSSLGCTVQYTFFICVLARNFSKDHTAFQS